MFDCTHAPSAELLKALGEFNRQEWFECHETLEDLWVGSEGEERDFYQGLLQVGVGLLHWRRGNYKGAVSLLSSGVEKLRRVRPVCQRIEVSEMIAAADLFREVLMTLGAEKMADMDINLIPRMRLITQAI